MPKTRMPWLAMLALVLGAQGAFAQAAPYDTSLLKNGNTWTYAVNQQERSAIMGTESAYQGIRIYTLDSVESANGAVEFRVTQRDSGTSYGYDRLDTMVVDGDTIPVLTWGGPTRDTTFSRRYTFAANAFQPGIPFFFIDQAFADSAPRVVYRGDTARRNHVAPNAWSCAWDSKENIEGVGRTRVEWSITCGHSRDFDLVRLTSFNGVPFVVDSVHPVALRTFANRPSPGARAPALLLRRGQVLYGAEGRTFDVQGKWVSSPAERVPERRTP